MNTNFRQLTRKGRRHWHWFRSEGLSRLVEEDDLNPWLRTTRAVRRWRWRRSHDLAAGTARPVWVVGVQRSGTNLVLRALGASGEFEIRNENDGAAFDDFMLRDDKVVERLVRDGRQRFVLFKPLCDAHRTDELLALPTATPGRAVWIYRSVDGRARSAVAKFGDANRRALADIAAGRAGDAWQAQRLSPETRQLIAGFDYSSMTPESAAALFWLARNRLFFELGLHEREDVLLSSYDQLLAEPDATIRRLCDFLGAECDPRMIPEVAARRPTDRLDLDPRIRAACDELEHRLGAALRP
jgi:hypothetical protein